MDRAVTALRTAGRALNSLESLLALPPTADIERDAASERLPDHAAVLRGWVCHMRADPPGSS